MRADRLAEIQRLETEVAQLQAQELALEQRVAALDTARRGRSGNTQRREENRRKFVIGAWVLAALKGMGRDFRAMKTEQIHGLPFDTWVARPDERALFELDH